MSCTPCTLPRPPWRRRRSVPAARRRRRSVGAARVARADPVVGVGGEIERPCPSRTCRGRGRRCSGHSSCPACASRGTRRRAGSPCRSCPWGRARVRADCRAPRRPPSPGAVQERAVAVLRGVDDVVGAAGQHRDPLGPADLVDRPVDVGVVGEEPADLLNARRRSARVRCSRLSSSQSSRPRGRRQCGAARRSGRPRSGDTAPRCRATRCVAMQLEEPNASSSSMYTAGRLRVAAAISSTRRLNVGQRAASWLFDAHPPCVGVQEVCGDQRDRPGVGQHVVAEDLLDLAVDGARAAALRVGAEALGLRLVGDLLEQADLVDDAAGTPHRTGSCSRRAP